MTTRGRPRKPIPELLLEGKFRADRHGDPATQWLPDGEPEMPSWLKGDAKTFWQSVVPALVKRGAATAVDATELAACCYWWAQFRKVSKAIDEIGDPTEKKYYSLSQIAGMAWKNFTTAAAKFGLNPSDRAKLRLEALVKPDDELLNFTKRT